MPRLPNPPEMARQCLLEQLARSLAWAEERKRAACMANTPPPRRPRKRPSPRPILAPPPATPEAEDRALGLEIYAAHILEVLQRAPRENNVVRLPAPLVDRICEQLDYLLRLRAA